VRRRIADLLQDLQTRVLQELCDDDDLRRDLESALADGETIGKVFKLSDDPGDPVLLTIVICNKQRTLSHAD
jgi:hypothetical protein